jgi:transcription elongation factor Elf1
MKRDAVVKEYTEQGGNFWCETCRMTRSSTKTTHRIFQSGREIQVSLCSECGSREEMEFYKGPKVRIQNKEGNRDGRGS